MGVLNRMLAFFGLTTRRHAAQAAADAYLAGADVRRAIARQSRREAALKGARPPMVIERMNEMRAQLGMAPWGGQ